MAKAALAERVNLPSLWNEQEGTGGRHQLVAKVAISSHQ
jgi:hypothetical protein